MPIYEYECKGCGHKFEAIQRISDGALQDCPECEQAELKKLISAAGFRLKGGGWYETDFKGSGKKRNLAGDKSSSGKDGAKTAASAKTEKTGS
ncbi:MAG: zinc ribbon domain-containing protein [Methylococcales bacterium]|nr:zinc ribbon domain-containing protein [Methylococcales bacterium]MEE2766529.1 zinc ribbon domain-containing protein [Pseudomonadota bacterium]